MVTESDEKNGLVKVYWSDVRERAAKVEPDFAKIVDELSPDRTFPLYLAYYRYGEVDADTQSSLFAKPSGGYYRLSDADAPKDVVKDLGYSIGNTPFGMVLEKQMECFIDLKKKESLFPGLSSVLEIFFLLHEFYAGKMAEFIRPTV